MKFKLFSLRYLDEDKAMFDEWSFQHFAAGAVVGGLGLLTLPQYFILHSLFEVWENTIGIADWKRWGWKRYEGDSSINMIGDTLSGCLGFYWVNKLTQGNRASPLMLITLFGVGAYIYINHPTPVDEDFMPDKIMKGMVSLGVLGGLGLGGYLIYKSIQAVKLK